VDLRAGLDDVEKRKFFTLTGLEHRLSVVQLVASRYTDYAIPAHPKKVTNLVLTGIFRFQPANQFVGRYHTVVSCTMNMEDIILKSFVNSLSNKFLTYLVYILLTT
jgi:hypothetical protein